MPSYYIPELIDYSGGLVSLSGGEFHHLANVRRQAKGDLITLNNGNGLLIQARILTIGKKEAQLELLEPVPVKRVAKYAIAFSLLKSQNDELIIEKCTELGTTAFFPFNSENSVKKPNPNSRERFARIALAAIKQCDNPFLPVIHSATPLIKQLQHIAAEGLTPIVCSERRPENWVNAGEMSQAPCFVIGPEGGWSDSEYSLFKEMNLAEITFSPLIARAETAAITIAGQWLYSSNLLSTNR